MEVNSMVVVLTLFTVFCTTVDSTSAESVTAAYNNRDSIPADSTIAASKTDAREIADSKIAASTPVDSDTADSEIDAAMPDDSMIAAFVTNVPTNNAATKTIAKAMVIEAKNCYDNLNEFNNAIPFQQKTKVLNALATLKNIEKDIKVLEDQSNLHEQKLNKIQNICKKQIENFLDVLVCSMSLSWGKNIVSKNCLPILQSTVSIIINNAKQGKVQIDLQESKHLELLKGYIKSYPEISVGSLKETLIDLIDYEDEERNWAICDWKSLAIAEAYYKNIHTFIENEYTKFPPPIIVDYGND